MKKEDWDKVQELFEKAARLPLEEREAFLAHACPEPALRQEIESLLGAEQNAGALEDALRQIASRHLEAAGPGESMIGDYRIIRQIGSGGMGLVYEAEQQHPKRVVALKVIRGGRYVDDMQVRLFQREAQALARLRHPAIASIFESGRTDDGQHFFAMELVRGEKLSDYVRRVDKDKSAADALAIKLHLFCHICDAVTYAHQKGVIHRDLKPANVLVQRSSAPSDSTSAGVPGVKILDFGLARITESDVAATSIVTSAGLIQGSLAYMSPEQASGNTDEIDLRTDIYSMGVLLYEMVSGRLPHDHDGKSLPESVRTISEDPPRPLSLPAGGRIPDRDLETIVFKALEKEPQNRYQSISALAGDVARYLANQPIIARPPSTVYQLRKLISRHRAAVSFAAVLLVVLMAFAVTMAYQARRIAEERDRANLEAGTSQEISDFLIDLFEVSDPGENRGNTVTARELLEKGAGRIEGSLTDRPRVQARLMDTMGKVHRSLGLYDKADELLDGAVRLRRRFPGDEEALATSLFNRGELKHYQRKFDVAEPLYKEALDIQLRLFGEDNLQVAQTVDLLGRLYRDKTDYGLATEYHTRALQVRRKLKGDRSLEVADSLHSLGMIAQVQNNFEEAITRYKEEYGIYQTHQQERPALAFNLGQALAQRAEYDEAETVLRRALALTQKMYGETHVFYAHCLRGLGSFLFDSRGNADAAEPLLRQSLALMKQSVGETHVSFRQATSVLVDLLEERGRLEEAEALARAGLTSAVAKLGDRHAQAVGYRSDLAGVLVARGKLDDAETLLASNPVPDAETADLESARMLIELGRLRRSQARHRDALAHFNEALQMRQQLLPAHHLLVAAAHLEVGRSLTDLSRYAEAEPHVRNGLATRRQHLGASHPRTLEGRDALMTLNRAWGRPEKLQDLRGPS